VKLKELTPAPPRPEENLHPLLALIFQESLAQIHLACGVQAQMAIHHFSIAVREDRDFETERADAVARIPSYGTKDYDCADFLPEPRPATPFDGSRHGTRIFFCVGVESLAFRAARYFSKAQSFR